ncbi:sulfite exporter TauE/SafE family protein [Bdellovibrionota bacterium FG-2]
MSIFGVALGSVLLSSFWGSAHCAAMCGPLVVAVGQTRLSVAVYQLARGLGYFLLGIAAGYVGGKVLDPSWGSGGAGFVPWLAAFGISFSFIGLGVQAWRSRGFGHSSRSAFFQRLQSRLWGRILAKPGELASAMAGVLSIFLPCGWLHSFVLASLVMQNPMKSGVFMLAFWAGTLPALSALPLFVRTLFSPLMKRAPRFVSVVLVLVGFATLGVKLVPWVLEARALAGGEVMGCHKCHDKAQKGE